MNFMSFCFHSRQSKSVFDTSHKRKMFLPLNETELSEDGSFLNGLLEVLDFGVRKSGFSEQILGLETYFSKTVMKSKKTFGLDFVSQVRS